MNCAQNKSWLKLIDVVILLSTLVCVACGKGFNKEDGENIVRQEEQADEKYNIVFRPLNQKVGRYSGWGGITIVENQIWVRVKINGPQIKDSHAQFLHEGARCPTMEDDINRDGYLDFMEAAEVVGEVLIPLDGNLNSQLKGLHEFPKTRSNDLYYYSESCNYTWLLEDLRRDDIFTTDMFKKLRPNEEPRFANRVVLIYGVSFDRRLPASVSTYDGYPAQALVPIACGEIRNGASTELN